MKMFLVGMIKIFIKPHCGKIRSEVTSTIVHFFVVGKDQKKGKSLPAQKNLVRKRNEQPQ